MATRRWRWASSIVAMLAIAGCTASPLGPDEPNASPGTDDPSPTVAAESPTAIEVPAESPEAVSERGNVVKDVGEAAVIVDSRTDVEVFALQVMAIEVSQSCPGVFATAPENGYFVVVEVTANMADASDLGASSGDETAFLIGPAMWTVVDQLGQAHSGLETDAAWACYETEERALYTLFAGEQTAGVIVLDSPISSGKLVFRPLGAEGWEWDF